nr:MAG TPA: hypothetical protein [Caudoviricetes sp.]
MAEFIDREKINEIAFTDAVLVKGEVKTERIAMLREIDEIPAADVREVVLCKDCKFNSGAKKCLNPNSFIAVPADDDYCSYGEKRA